MMTAAADNDQPRNDRELLERVTHGDRPAFAELVERHHERFFRLAWRLLRDDADAADTVQEAFLRLWQQPERFDHRRGVRFTTWFYRVVVNLCLDRMRKYRPEVPADGPDPAADGSENPEHLVDELRRHRRLAAALERLPPRQKAALVLCFYEEHRNREAAEIMGVSLKALQSLLIRAKRTLKQELGSLSGD
ncbi:MAG: sigma-70 family RNA polymerase sigma factor [Deltaproteobacteria bacterium]|nr:sigma-70 family RNA polymerase sigma factor [Candidatus Anaeroferrophillacea bacterium]